MSLVLLVLAFICFILAAAQAPIPRANLTALGLGLWILSELLGHVATIH